MAAGGARQKVGWKAAISTGVVQSAAGELEGSEGLYRSVALVAFALLHIGLPATLTSLAMEKLTALVLARALVPVLALVLALVLAPVQAGVS